MTFTCEPCEIINLKSKKPNKRDKAAKKAYDKEYYQKKKEERRVYAASWREDNRDWYNARRRVFNAKNPDRVKNNYLNTMYGISLQEKTALLELQGGCCAICSTDDPGKKDWFVDHCHTTNVVRGLLCLHCNSVLGYARDNPAVLSSAIDYLAKDFEAQEWRMPKDASIH